MIFLSNNRTGKYSVIRRNMLLVWFATALYVLSCAGVNAQVATDQLAVVLAVAPTYSPTALHTHTSGEAVVEVKINPDGSVISAEGVSGSPLLIGGSQSAALRWKFASGSKGVRVVRLTFVYHLAPRGTPVEDLVAVFKPPYQVEITHLLPDETSLP